MTANELADELDNLEIVCKNPSYLIGMETYEQAFLRCNSKLKMKKEAATMLRQQQAEIEALKEKVKQNADLEEKVDLCKEKLKPIVWMSEVEGGTMYTNYEYPKSVPLYTHPVKEQDIGISHAIGFDDGFKAGMQRAVEMDVVNELTDEEIRHIQAICHLKDVGYDGFIMRFARAILRKAQEK